MLSAIVLIVASQLVLAGLLFGTTAIDRPSPLPGMTWSPARRRRRRSPDAAMHEHQQQISSLRAATARVMSTADH